MTVVVLGLDALDTELAERWDCGNLLLDRHGGIETFAHTKEYPITSEVWPTIATGKLPSEGGHAGTRGSDWEGLLGVADSLAKVVLPQSVRAEIGRYLRNGREVDAHFGPTDGDHLFADGAVYNWPGITPAQNWARSERWLATLYDGELSDVEFLRRQAALTGEEFGWAIGMSDTWLPIVGTRSHILDHAGHAWCQREEKLRKAYEVVDDMVEVLLFAEHVDDIVVVSDHGIQTSFLGDDEPGSHSWRATIATTVAVEGPLPEHVVDVRSWVDQYVPDAIGPEAEWDGRTIDTPTEHLEDLGYI